MEHSEKSVYHTGAYDGTIMGILFVAIFTAYAYGAKSGAYLFDALALLASAVVVPAMLAYMMRRRYIEDQCNSHFSAVWMHGITIMICGNLVLGWAIYVYLRFINPFFIIDQVPSAIEAYRQIGSADAEALADTLQKMVDQKLLPSPIQFAFSTMWLGSFLGCILSLVLSAIIKAAVRIRKS